MGRKAGRYVSGLIILAISVVTLYFAFGIIRFLFTFDINLCYSDAISNLAEASAKVALSDNQNLKHEYDDFVKHLPLAGYETICTNVDLSTKRFLKHVNETTASKEQ